MHAEAMEFVSRALIGKKFDRVVEIGSRNINGSVRPLFIGKVEDDYWGIDLHEGPDVDEVADASDWAPQGLVDCVVCCEVLEHAPNVEHLVEKVSQWLSPGGWFLMTCAAPDREPHSSIDGGPLRPGEFYSNIEPTGFQELLDIYGLYVERMEYDMVRGDLRVVAQRR
jgi:hypothetical protein